LLIKFYAVVHGVCQVYLVLAVSAVGLSSRRWLELGEFLLTLGFELVLAEVENTSLHAGFRHPFLGKRVEVEERFILTVLAGHRFNLLTQVLSHFQQLIMLDANTYCGFVCPGHLYLGYNLTL
jgi:hypothetical protein